MKEKVVILSIPRTSTLNNQKKKTGSCSNNSVLSQNGEDRVEFREQATMGHSVLERSRGDMREHKMHCRIDLLCE